MGLFGLPAQAVIITVGGVDYDVVFFANAYDTAHPSYNDNFGVLTNPAIAPWFGVAPDGLGGTVDAEDFANAYAAQVPGSPDVSSATDKIVFVYGVGGSTSGFATSELGVVSSHALSSASVSLTDVYAYTVPIPSVPEIDGNALAKALFILFALGAWLHARRARVS